MEEKNEQEIAQEDIAKREKTFESLKEFFASDLRIKEALAKLAPTEMDDFDEESRIKYTDKLYKELRDFKNIIQNFEFGSSLTASIQAYFARVREATMLGNYEKGAIQRLYREQFSDMNSQLIEEVKDKCVGYTLLNNLGYLMGKAKTINELLHIVHSHITNNEGILQALPIIATKDNKGKYPITLYGEETELSRELFEDFPDELDCGWTDIISMKDKILMMVRDRGHALTIDIDIAKESDVLVRYFVPKLCNRSMIESLPGVNAISENGANGLFQTSKSDMSERLIDFIGKVPTDLDMPYFQNMMKAEEKKQDSSESAKEEIFGLEDMEDITIETGEKGRRISRLLNLQNKLKEAANKLKGKITGKDSQETGGNTNDETTRD